MSTTALKEVGTKLAELHPDWDDFNYLFEKGRYKNAHLLLLCTKTFYSTVDPTDVLKLVGDLPTTAAEYTEVENRLRSRANSLILVEEAIKVVEKLI